MPDQQLVETLRIALTARQVADRKTAIAHALDVARQPDMHDAVKGLLMGVVTNDTDMGVRTAAKDALRSLEKNEPNDDARHMVPVDCPDGSRIYVDRRRVCASDGTLVRMRSGGSEFSVMRMRSGEKDVIRVWCPACNEYVQVEIDCQGY